MAPGRKRSPSELTQPPTTTPMTPFYVDVPMHTSNEGTSSSIDGKQTGKYCEKLSNEIGLTVRQHALLEWKMEFFLCLTMKEKKFPTMVEAKRNPHEFVSNRKIGTIFVIDFQNGEMVGQIELFKLVHWKSQDGWINQEARDYYVRLF
ncbi:hypothetical protein AAG906_024964 [Vitis piasezkii]